VEHARPIAVGRHLHRRVPAHPLDEARGAGGEELVGPGVDARRPLLDLVVRLEDRAELADELRRGRRDQERGDRAVVDAEPDPVGVVRASSGGTEGREQDLLLDRDVPEEAAAELPEDVEVDRVPGADRALEERLEEDVVLGEVRRDGTAAAGRLRGRGSLLRGAGSTFEPRPRPRSR
jgi:hypothetical protein